MKIKAVVRPYPKIYDRLHSLKITYDEIAPRLNLSKTSFNSKMQGRVPWQLHEAYRLVDIIGHPGDNERPAETVADYFPRDSVMQRKVSK